MLWKEEVVIILVYLLPSFNFSCELTKKYICKLAPGKISHTNKQVTQLAEVIRSHIIPFHVHIKNLVPLQAVCVVGNHLTDTAKLYESNGMHGSGDLFETVLFLPLFDL